MALSRVVSEIFNVEKYRDLEIGVRGHSSLGALVVTHAMLRRLTSWRCIIIIIIKVIESCTIR